MAEFECADCETQISEDEDEVNCEGGFPCPRCGLRGEWMRVATE